jgi:diamine N-acetyltransferase
MGDGLLILTKPMEPTAQLPWSAADAGGLAYTLRQCEPGDRVRLEAMYESFEPKRAAQGLPPADPTAVRRWLARVLAAGQHIVAESAGHLVGHVMLMPMEAGTVELANFVHQSRRDRGIGTALNRAAIELARGAGLERVWLSVEPSNRAAIRSYEKAGFTALPGSLWAPEREMAIRLG